MEKSEIKEINETEAVQCETPEDKGQKLDFTFLLARLCLRWYIPVIFMVVGAVAGLLYCHWKPKEYEASITLLPEDVSKTSSQLAMLMGVGGAGNGEDAYSPALYPKVVASIPFLIQLFDVPVEMSTNDTTFTVREYLQDKIKEPWWAGLSLPMPSISDGDATVPDPGKGDGEILDPFHLSPEEMGLVNALRKRISAYMDKKTGEILITSMMQDPLTAAQLTDTVAARLQEYITDYRTAKARSELDNAMLANDEAKQQYFQAQQIYAEYKDQNQGIATYEAQSESDRLENDMRLAFNLYNQTAQQVQTARHKVEEQTPVFAVLNPSTVPLHPLIPQVKRTVMMAAVVFLLLGCLVTLWPILFGRRFLEVLHRERRNMKLRLPEWCLRIIRRRTVTEETETIEDSGEEDCYRKQDEEKTVSAVHSEEESYYVMPDSADDNKAHDPENDKEKSIGKNK